MKIEKLVVVKKLIIDKLTKRVARLNSNNNDSNLICNNNPDNDNESLGIILNLGIYLFYEII